MWYSSAYNLFKFYYLKLSWYYPEYNITKLSGCYENVEYLLEKKIILSQNINVLLGML